MWRTRAITSMLLEEIGGLPPDDVDALARARRKGAWVVAIDWLAIVVLVALHDGGIAQLTLGGSEQTLFTIGILVVAVHSGFRLGQLEKLRAIERLRAELEERSEQ